MSAIEIRDVTKQFDAVVAVNHLTLSVPTGSIYGFIGPNGSGKTTTIRMIMNILVPDSGQIQVLDRPSASQVRDQVGYLPEERGLYKRMTVRQVLRYYGQLKGKSTSQLDPVIKKWLERLELSDWADKKIVALSKGMSQKVQFISTIVAEPKLLILDEPFSGLDPVNADALRDAVLDLRRQGMTVVFSTHDMAAAERLCDRIFMIFRGNKVLDGTLADIQSQYGQDTVRVRTDAGAAALDGLPQVASFADVGNFQDVRLKGGAQEFLHALSAKTAVHHFELKSPSLHDIFVRIARPSAEEMREPVGRQMSRILVVATTEFLTLVKTKAFILGILMLPVLLGLSFGFQIFAARHADVEDHPFAVIDHTGVLYPAIVQAAEAHNRESGDGQNRTGPYFVPSRINPGDRPLGEVRADLSTRVRKKELFAFVEIPASVLDVKGTTADQIDYYTETPSYDQLPSWLNGVLQKEITERRFVTASVDPNLVAQLTRAARVTTLGLVERKADGTVSEAKRVNQLATFALPFGMMYLLFIALMSSAPQLLTAVIEEKMSRISEVLISSITPTQLMLGKLLGVAGVATVLALVYLGGGVYALLQTGQWDLIKPTLLLWFVVYLLCAVLMFGSVFVAIGAACSDLKDSQSMMQPIMIFLLLPMFASAIVLRQPNATLSVAASLFPTASPFLMLIRLAMTPPPPMWQVALSVVLTLGTTAVFIWAAARIFRVGLLMQGKPPNLPELLKWIRA